MWYVLRFIDNGTLQGIVVSEGAGEEEAANNARSRIELPAGDMFGLPYNGEPPVDLRYRIITLNDTAAVEALMRNAAMSRMRNQWFWIRFVDEDDRSERGVALSDGTTFAEALERLASHIALPPAEPEGYPYPAYPPEHLRYRMLSQDEIQEFAGGFTPSGVGGWANAIVGKVMEHDISTLPNAGVLQQMLDRINKLRNR
jgi:hypothetical protein